MGHLEEEERGRPMKKIRRESWGGPMEEKEGNKQACAWHLL